MAAAVGTAEVRRVLHLVGSAVDPLLADVSALYARDALGALHDPARWEHVVAHVSPDGTWRFPAGADPLGHEALAAAEPLALPDAVARLQALAPDVALPQMFCVPGMTHYRALLDLLGIPFVGNRPAVMAAAADKAWSRALVAGGGVAVPDGGVVAPGDEPPAPLPLVVKPVDADNSLGLTLVHERAAWDDAVAAACAASPSGRALAETYVELGREVRCGVVDLDGELVALPLEEYTLDRDTHPLRTHEDKLARDEQGEMRLVAKDPTRAWVVPTDDPLTPVVLEAALACYRAMGCRHHGLFDFRVDPDGRPWFLEAGLYCSFARQSVVVVMAAAAGTDVADLFAAGVALATGTSPTRHPSQHQEEPWSTRS